MGTRLTMVQDVFEVPHDRVPNIELDELGGRGEVPTRAEVVSDPNLGASHLGDWCRGNGERWSIGLEVQNFKCRDQVGLGDCVRGDGFRV